MLDNYKQCIVLCISSVNCLSMQSMKVQIAHPMKSGILILHGMLDGGVDHWSH